MGGVLIKDPKIQSSYNEFMKPDCSTCQSLWIDFKHICADCDNYSNFEHIWEED